MLEIFILVLGPVQTNTYLIADPETKEAVVIDPAWEGKRIVEEAKRRNWHLTHIWLTHAHFDHMAGVGAIVDILKPAPVVALHPEDHPLYRLQGGAPLFGMRIDPAPEPTVELRHRQILTLGSNKFEVRHAPGHTQGHVVFYCELESIVFCGDVIFSGGIGRTDLPGGDFRTLIKSIQTQILTLPDNTRLLSGHGPETTVGEEKRHNPFLTK